MELSDIRVKIDAVDDQLLDLFLQRMYNGLDQDIFTIHIQPAAIQHITDLETYNEQEGLALSPAEIEYLHGVEKQLGRGPTNHPSMVVSVRAVACP